MISESSSEVLILDIEQIKQDLMKIKGSSKIAKTIFYAIKVAQQFDENKISYDAFVIALQKCKIRKMDDIVKIEKFVLDRTYQDRKIKLWPPPVFISTIVSVQTFFFIIHTLHLSLFQEVPFADCIWS